ncbi:MAG: hypothetical protein LC792_07880 [Actinobacteria bacterium]|nr:hypothetical protein [Actinomycetota bacterium]
MNPNAVFSASLVTSLVLWYPSMQACLHGDLDLAPAGLRYLAALFVARLAMNSQARLVNAYRASQDAGSQTADAAPGPAASASPAAAQSNAATPHRRRNDRPVDPDANPGVLAA